MHTSTLSHFVVFVPDEGKMMESKPNADSRVCHLNITADDRARRILSIEQRNNLDLTLLIHGKAKNRNFGVLSSEPGDENHNVEVRQYRYSIHRSPDSVLGLNTIKLTRELTNGDFVSLVQYTFAIKRDRAFTPLFAYRLSQLNDAEHDVSAKKGASFSLGKYKLLEFTPYLAVFVGAPDVTFFHPADPTFRHRQIKFEAFSVVILWSFMSAPSHPTSALNHLASPPETVLDGLSPVECVDFYRANLGHLKQECVETCSKDIPAHLRWVLEQAIFCATPSRDSELMRQWAGANFARALQSQAANGL